MKFKGKLSNYMCRKIYNRLYTFFHRLNIYCRLLFFIFKFVDNGLDAAIIFFLNGRFIENTFLLRLSILEAIEGYR